ncbi:MAG: hypothetical protein ABJ308_15720 [Halieaceae bacterium]
MKQFLRYLAWSVATLVALMAVMILLFAFIIPNPLGVTDRNTISQANAFGINEGLKVRSYINRNGSCPDNLEGWSSESRLSEFQYEVSIPKDGRAGRTIPIWYTCKENLDYVFWVRHSIDSGISITGGKDMAIKIQYGHFTDLKDLSLADELTQTEVISILIESKLITSKASGRINAPLL